MFGGGLESEISNDFENKVQYQLCSNKLWIPLKIQYLELYNPQIKLTIVASVAQCRCLARSR